MSETGNKSAKTSTPEKASAEMPSSKEGSTEPETNKVSRSTKIPLLNNKLSRSHDNLASMLRKKAVQMSVSKKMKGTEHMLQAEQPAEGQTVVQGQGGQVMPKVKSNMKSLVMPTMHKSTSIQNFDKGKNFQRFSARAQSVQNICRIPLPIGTKGIKAPLVPKRSSSAQNMINNGQRSTRLPQSTAAAYNAELLSNFEKEKKSLERRISELIQISENRKADVEKLKFEMKKKAEEMSEGIDILRLENQKLREQLHEHGITIAHFTDNDKILLLEQMSSENRNSSEVVHDDTLGSFHAASEGAESLNLNHSNLGLSVGNLSNLTALNASLQSIDICSLERQNSLSVDRGLNEIGIAYLRDRILQMQETHYSTNEELQATLQELSDLQDNVNELSAENERLIDEKSILLESLCTQTEKLENARLQIAHLKALLIQDSDNNDRSANERQLAVLIKSSQEEREELLLKQAEFNNALTMFENENRELQDIVSALRDRAELEESKSKVYQNDKRMLESQICDMKNQNITDQLEIAKYKALLDAERQKFAKVGVDGGSESRNKNEEILALARREKEAIEEQLNLTNQELVELKNELMKMKEQNVNLTEALQTSQTNSRMQTKKLESRIEEMELEKMKIIRKLEIQDEDLSQLQAKHKQATEECKSQTAKSHQLENDLVVTRKHVDDLNETVEDERKNFKEEQAEWLQLQKDLQLAVVIANDLKTEAEFTIENVNTENQILKEKLSNTMKELNTIRSERDSLRQRDLDPSSATLAASRLVALRQGRLSNESNKAVISDLIVKQIIASAEDLTKGNDRPLASPTSPSSHDGFSRFRDIRHESNNAVEGVTDNADVNSTPNQRLPVLETSSSISPGVFNDSRHHDSVVDTDMSESESATPSNASGDSPKKPLVGILMNKMQPRKSKFSSENYDKTLLEKTATNGSGSSYNNKLDPLAFLAKQLGGSKRNALLRWCQNKTASYPGIDITNFSSSWNDGLAFCALLHSYMPDKIPFKDLNSQDKMRNFKCAFEAAESIGITTGPDTNVLIVTERPDWQAVFSYITSIYKHFEVDIKS